MKYLNKPIIFIALSLGLFACGGGGTSDTTTMETWFGLLKGCKKLDLAVVMRSVSLWFNIFHRISVLSLVCTN